MKFFEWVKSLANILKKDDLHKYNGDDLEGLIVAGTTGDILAAKTTVTKTAQNIMHLPTMIFWDKMERFLYGTFRDFEDQIKMANKFEAETDDYAKFVKKQISIINQIEDDEKVDFFAMLTRAFLLDCVQTRELYFKLAKFLMLCTADELLFLQKCDYTFASPITVMISGLYQFGLFEQSTDEKGNARYVLSDFAKALKQNSLNFYQEMHGEKRIGTYEEMQPSTIPEPMSADDLDKIFANTELVLNGGNASGYDKHDHAAKQGISLPAATKIVERGIEKHDDEIEQMLSDI